MIRGTAWRCMLEPISARLASSFSRKGDQGRRNAHQLVGRDVHQLDLVALDHHEFTGDPGGNRRVDILEASLMGALAWAMGWSFSSKALKNLTSLDTVALSFDHPVGRLDKTEIVHFGVSAQRNDESDVGPSGVSMGQIRP
jgi:hypothetical protein